MAAKVGKMVWTGRILSLLVSALFLASAGMKLMAPDKAREGMKPMGLPERLIFPLGVLEITCVAIYLFPPTAVLGAILLTGYLGGAICTHLRVGDTIFPHIVIGIIVWLGIFLRDQKLRSLIPFRR